MFGRAKIIMGLALLLLMPVAGADVLDEVMKSGKLRVGVSMFVPWTMQDKQGRLSGFEVDVAEKIAQDMGVKAEFKIYPWAEIIAALERGEIDMISAGMAITPARALRVNFTQPYAESGISMATNTALTSDIDSFAELNDKDIVITAVNETVAADLARRLFDKAKIKSVKTEAEAQRPVLKGEAHAYMATLAEAKFLALNHPEKIDVPLEKPLLTSKTGLAVKKGEQELLNFLNAWITAREADKWLPTAHKYWFNSLDWQAQVSR